MKSLMLLIALAIVSSCSTYPPPTRPPAAAFRPAQRQVLRVQGWEIVGTLQNAPGRGRRPAVLMLNKAAGTREAYAQLADELARRGISSLRIDLRGHGDSINLGKFVPGDPESLKLLDGTWNDVVAGLAFLSSRRSINAGRVAIVGASYSSEAMAEAARHTRHFAGAYVALSPGSFGEDSARNIDSSGVRWLIVRSARERSPSVRAAAEMVDEISQTAEVWVLDASAHATDVLTEVPTVNSRIAEWLAASLRG